MAAKKRNKKSTRKAAAKKAKPAKKIVRRKPATKRIVAKKKSPKKSAAKKSATRTSALAKKTTSPKSGRALTKRAPTRRQSLDDDAFTGPGLSSQAGQSGDLQGLSDRERADSESVDELLEEGNAFEADVVSGVQSADDHEGQEVRTHEVPEDDVPGEYLDED
ncbi:MAG: hypothetical protein WBM24_06785 [Candidatus Sulfotelmatobacter sp.]|jgi:hypothetical protein